MRAFFNPEPAEDSQLKRGGIQARPFYFASESESEAGLDGGLIEIKCFRARGRRRRAPDPEDFRGGQEKYGLDLPKGNLLDCPEDARYYDWLLVDPKDSPYASFRFHYRAWEHLVALSLIPQQNPKILLTRTSSMWSLAHDAYTKDQDAAQAVQFKKAVEDEEILEFHEELTLKEHYSGRPLPVPGAQSTTSHSRAVSERPPTPFAMDLLGDREPSRRLLPVPPDRREPVLHRASSTISTANSITPSLYAYIDREKNSESPVCVFLSEFDRLSHSIPVLMILFISSRKTLRLTPGQEPFVGLAASVSMTHSLANYVEDSTFWDEGLSQLSVESPPRGNTSPSRDSNQASEAMSPARSANQSPDDIEDSFWDDGLSQLSVESPARGNTSPRHDTKRLSQPLSPDMAASGQNSPDNYLQDSFWDDSLPQSVESPAHGNVSLSYGTTRSSQPASLARTEEAVNTSTNCYQRPTLQDDDDDTSESLSEFPMRANAIPSYGILRPPEAMFSPTSVAALRQNREDFDLHQSVSPTRLPLVSSYSDMFKIRTDHDMLPAASSDNMASSRYSTLVGQEDSSGGLTGDDWLLQTPSPIQKRYEESQAIRSLNFGMRNVENEVELDSINEDIESEHIHEHVESKFVPRPRSTPSSGTWI